MAYIQADMPFYLIGGSLDTKQNFPTIIAMKEANEEDFGKTALCGKNQFGACLFISGDIDQGDGNTG